MGSQNSVKKRKLRIRGMSGEYIAFTVGLAGSLVFIAALDWSPRRHHSSELLGAAAVVLLAIFYRLWFRPVVLTQKVLRIPQGMFDEVVVPISQVADIGLLYRARSADSYHYPPAWFLEICDAAGVRTEVQGFLYNPLKWHRRRLKKAARDKSALGGSPLGKSAIKIYEWVLARQGPNGLLVISDFEERRVRSRSGSKRELGWWSPKGQMMNSQFGDL